MRNNTLSIDMDFRIIPSVVPLHSPSPDKKSINIIAPTISPNIAQIKKQTTPIKNIKLQKQNYRNIHQQQTDFKYYSNHNDHSSSALKQKDQIIKNLKNLIDMITQNSRFKKSSHPEEQQLKNQIKILTIQNQKLVNIIEKMSKNKNIEQNTGKIDHKNETKISQLMKTIKQNQMFYQQQAKQLKRFNKSLNNQIKNLQIQKRDLQQENKKLLKILKQRNESQKFNLEKMKLSDTSQNSNQEKIHTITSNKSQQRLSLMKIRQQHSQNLKMLKQGLIRQIEQTFDTMKIAIDGMNSKLIAQGKRLQSIQKMIWNRIRNTQTQRQSITISIRQGQSNQPLQSDRSFKPEKRNNSQIYIQQGTSSSNERISRDQFARLEQIPSQKNLINPLQQELNTTKAELQQLRFKYQKLCLDTSSVAFSQRVIIEEAAQIQQKYQAIIIQNQMKDKQIKILYEQIKQIQTNSISKIEQLELNHEQERRIKQQQTEQNVKILVQNYEKQLDILRKQIVNLNSIQKQQTQYSQASEALLLKIQQLKNQNSQLQYHLKQTRESLHEVSKNMEYNQRIFLKKLEQSQKNAQKQQNFKQQLQQKTILLNSEVNQHKIYIQSLKYDLSTKTQQYENIKNIQIESSQNYRKENQNNKQLRQSLSEKEDEVNELRKILIQLHNNSVFDEVVKLQTLAYNISRLSEQHLINSQNIQQSSQSPYDLIQKLQRQNHQLHTQLLAKDQKNIQLQAKIIQLHSLYDLTKRKLNQQQQIYLYTIDKLTILQKNIQISQKTKNSNIQISKDLGNSSKNLLQKITIVKKMQQQLQQKIIRILENDRNVGNISL